MQLTKKDFTEILKSELPQILGTYGVITKTNLSGALKEYGVTTQKDLVSLEKKIDVKMDLKLKKLERSLTIKITKSKNDLAQRIASVAVAKEERAKVERIEKRVTTIENFIYA